MKYWWSHNHSHQFLAKSETKFFFWNRRVPPLDQKNFLTPILMKLNIFDPYGLRILEFHQNQSQKFFLIKRGDPSISKKNFCLWFSSNFEWVILRPSVFQILILIQIGDNFFFLIQRGDPSLSKKFLSPIFLKFWM